MIIIKHMEGGININISAYNAHRNGLKFDGQEYHKGMYYPIIPEDAHNGIYPPNTAINPFEKYNKGNGLNFQERHNFEGVCENGPIQLISCYKDMDNKLCKGAFELLCSNCPHCVSKECAFDNVTMDIMKPFFLINWMKKQGIDTNGQHWHIYYISDTHFIKIGKSNEKTNRISELQTGNPNKLKVLFKIYVDTEENAYKVEHLLHTTYGLYKKEGEWFDILDKLQLKAWKTFFKEE